MFIFEDALLVDLLGLRELVICAAATAGWSHTWDLYVPET
jgi:hypothetical protein